MGSYLAFIDIKTIKKPLAGETKNLIFEAKIKRKNRHRILANLQSVSKLCQNCVKSLNRTNSNIKYRFCLPIIALHLLKLGDKKNA